jgi:hypothetical protein
MSRAGRIRPCQSGYAAGRLAKAREFWEQVEMVESLAEHPRQVATTVVSLCVLAGVAASDAISCLSLGRHARGEDHREACDLLRQVRPNGRGHASDLGVLLGLKTAAARRARRAAERLVAAATERAHAAG